MIYATNFLMLNFYYDREMGERVQGRYQLKTAICLDWDQANLKLHLLLQHTLFLKTGLVVPDSRPAHSLVEISVWNYC